MSARAFVCGPAKRRRDPIAGRGPVEGDAISPGFDPYDCVLLDEAGADFLTVAKTIRRSVWSAV